MSYTFGGATTDDASVGAPNALGGSNGTCVIAGWFRPTTLTAGRTYWSAGNTIRCEVDSTTSELRLITDNTTDGQWTTSGAGITTDEWQFLAFFGSFHNTGPAGAWRVWVGDQHGLGDAITPSVAVSPSGNFTSSGTYYAGNAGTGSVAFQGDIGWLFMGAAINQSTIGPWGVATAGAIADEDELRVLNAWIRPLWRGEINHEALKTGTLTHECGAVVMDFAGTGFAAVTRGYTTLTPQTGTINGAVYSPEEPPIRMARNSLLFPQTAHWAA